MPLPSWQDDDGADDERLIEGHFRNVWARVGVSDHQCGPARVVMSSQVEPHSASAHNDRAPSTVPPQSILHLGRSGGKRIQFGAFGVMFGREAVEWVSCFIQQCSMQFPRCHRQTTAKSQLSISGKDCPPDVWCWLEEEPEARTFPAQKHMRSRSVCWHPLVVHRRVGHKQSELLWMWITKVVWRLPGRQMSIVAEIHVQRETPRQEPIFHPMSDTESVESVAGTVDPVVETPDDPELLASFPGNITLRMALVTLDDPCAVFRQRAAVMKSVPHVLRGHFGNALKLALEEATWRNCQDDEVRHERRWKLVMLLPRMLLHRPPCGGSIPRTKLVASLEAFSGEWIQLFTAGAACDEKAAIGRIQQSRRRGGDELERRVLRAERLVHVGELSSDR